MISLIHERCECTDHTKKGLGDYYETAKESNGRCMCICGMWSFISCVVRGTHELDDVCIDLIWYINYVFSMNFFHFLWRICYTK